MTEKMITTAKLDNLHSKRQAYSFITKEDVAKKLFDDIAFRIFNEQTNHLDFIIGTIIGFGKSDKDEYIILNNVERNRKPDNTIVYYLKDITEVNEVCSKR